MEMLLKINGTLNQVVKGQEQLEACFTTLQEKLNIFNLQLKDLEQALIFNGEEIKDLKSSIADMKREEVMKHGTIENHTTQLKELQEQIDQLEHYSCDFNL